MTRMKMTLLMIATYGGGMALAAWGVSHGHTNSELALTMLPVLAVAHLCCRTISRKRPTYANLPKCLACQNDLTVFRRVARHRFCCQEHEQMYVAELQKIAVARLRSARLAMAPPGNKIELPRHGAEDGTCAALLPSSAHASA